MLENKNGPSMNRNVYVQGLNAKAMVEVSIVRASRNNFRVIVNFLSQEVRLFTHGPPEVLLKDWYF